MKTKKLFIEDNKDILYIKSFFVNGDEIKENFFAEYRGDFFIDIKTFPDHLKILTKYSSMDKKYPCISHSGRTYLHARWYLDNTPEYSSFLKEYIRRIKIHVERYSNTSGGK